DRAERRTGVAGQAGPSDGRKASGTACADDGNPCTLDQCDGTTVDCQHPAGNAGAVCRAAGGPCDVAEVCSGTRATCPADLKEEAGMVCRPMAGDCVVGEVCDGTSGDCPEDRFASAPSG